jgi:hypothetical protein
VRADTLTAVMRTFLAAVLAVVFVALVPLADLALWAQRELIGTTPFVRLGEQVVDQNAVRAALADRIVTNLEAANPALIAADAPARTFVTQQLASPAVKPAFDDLLASTHDQLRQGHDPLQLDLSPLLPVLRQQLPANLASRLPTTVFLAPVTVLSRRDAPAVWESVQLVQNDALVVVALTVVALVGAIAVARNRGPLCIILGLATAAIAVGVIALVKPGRSLLESQSGTSTQRAAFLAGYDTVTHSFVQQTVVLAALGVALTVAGLFVYWSAGRNLRPSGWA